MESLNPALEFLQNYAGIDLASHLDNPAYLDILQKFPIQRYATVSEDSDWFYKSMLRITLDEMDDYHEGNTWGESRKDDPGIVDDARIIGLYDILKQEHSKSRLTVGVSVSPFVGALGKFHPFTGRFFMRSYHAADFSKKLDLHDHTINKQEVITGGYDLKQGYSKKMEDMLNPQLLFKDLFASAVPEPLPTPGIFDITIPAPVDPTVALTTGVPFTPGGPRDIHAQLYPNGIPSFDEWWGSDLALQAKDFDYWHAYAYANDWVDPDTGRRLWPPNRGADEYPAPVVRTIQPSENLVIDRYTRNDPLEDDGTFFGRAGDSYPSRALPYDEDSFPADNPRRYQVIGPLQVTEATTSPWFGQPGGAKQYEIVKLRHETIDDLTRPAARVLPLEPSPPGHPGRPAVLRRL